MRTLAATAVVLGLCACSSDPPPRSTTRTIGEACSSDSSCSLGSACATAMPGGLCTYSCSGDTCPTGAVCADLRASGSGLLCAKACTAQSDCRSGYTCCAGFGACVPAANCPAQNRPASADLGKACGAGCATASGEICVGDANHPEFPGGACTAACNPSDQTTCPTNGKCVSTASGSFCFPACVNAGDCAAPLSSCVAGVCRAPTFSPACTPPGSPNVVLGGVSGPAAEPACNTAQAAPVGTPALASQAFGTKTVGTTVSFTVPPGTGSFSILSQGANVPVSSVTLNGSQIIPNSVVPTLVTNPANRVIFDDLPSPPADGSGTEVFYGGFSPFTGMMTIPNTSLALQQAAVAGGLQPGTWKFTVNDFSLECAQVTNCSPKTPSGNSYDIRVLTKPGLPASTGTVDIAFYFLGGSVSSAAAAQTNPAFTRMLQTLSTLYANAGLCLGTVTLYDVPAWAKSKWPGLVNADDESVCGDLSQIFTLAANGNHINFFFVNGFKANSGQGLSVVGVDGTIPGPSSLAGNVSSGASVNGSDLTTLGCGGPINVTGCGADEVAYIVAHEGGHFMGLYHTTEQTGDSFDTLSDTPTCPCSSCAPPNEQRNCAPKNPSSTPPTFVRNESCLAPTGNPPCGGGDNLMFWLFSASSTGALSPHQGQVMRSNLVVR